MDSITRSISASAWRSSRFMGLPQPSWIPANVPLSASATTHVRAIPAHGMDGPELLEQPDAGGAGDCGRPRRLSQLGAGVHHVPVDRMGAQHEPLGELEAILRSRRASPDRHTPEARREGGARALEPAAGRVVSEELGKSAASRAASPPSRAPPSPRPTRVPRGSAARLSEMDSASAHPASSPPLTPYRRRPSGRSSTSRPSRRPRGHVRWGQVRYAQIKIVGHDGRLRRPRGHPEVRGRLHAPPRRDRAKLACGGSRRCAWRAATWAATCSTTGSSKPGSTTSAPWRSVPDPGVRGDARGPASDRHLRRHEQREIGEEVEAVLGGQMTRSSSATIAHESERSASASSRDSIASPPDPQARAERADVCEADASSTASYGGTAPSSE